MQGLLHDLLTDAQGACDLPLGETFEIVHLHLHFQQLTAYLLVRVFYMLFLDADLALENFLGLSKSIRNQLQHALSPEDDEGALC